MTLKYVLDKLSYLDCNSKAVRRELIDIRKDNAKLGLTIMCLGVATLIQFNKIQMLQQDIRTLKKESEQLKETKGV